MNTVTKVTVYYFELNGQSFMQLEKTTLPYYVHFSRIHWN